MCSNISRKIPVKKYFKIIIFIVIIGGLGALFLIRTYKQSPDDIIGVKVKRGEICDKAFAVGTIEARNEINIKSRFSGNVEHFFVDVGDKVKKGDSLLVIKPTPTIIELAEAKKHLQLAEIEFENIKMDMNRQKVLKNKNYICDDDYEDTVKNFEKARLNLELAQEKLNIIEKGKVKIGGISIESVIESPITGTILQKYVNKGDPVVPLTSYQPGTELLTIASIDSLIFKGTVDEIDVGRVKEGMKAEITIGALPQEKIEGEIIKIAPKAHKKQNATVFYIEIRIVKKVGQTLRVGYSATVDIIIDNKENILIIPEEAVHFEENKKYVYLQNNEKREIQIGLSDGFKVEVISGLTEGETVIMK